MLKRILSLFLSIVMVLSCVPFQVFAEENVEEATEAVQIEETQAEEEALPEETEEEVTEPEVTEPEVTESEETEPEASEPETTEPEATEPEVTEPEETEPEVTEPEEIEPEEKQELRLLPATRIVYRTKTVTATEDVRKVTVDENGIATYEDVTETHSFTYKYPDVMNTRPLGTKSIGEGNWGNYTFTTFEDLQQLCTIGDQGYTDIQYIGDGPLVISGDVTIPAYTTLISWDEPIVINKGATLEVEEYGFLNCDTLTVNGSYVSHSWNDHVESALTVNGSMTVYNNLYLGLDATVSGFSRIELVNEYSCLSKNATLRSFADFKSALTKAQKDTSGVSWELHYNSEDVPEVVIEESITVPEGVTVTLGWYDICDVVIPEGVTLEINDSYYGSSFYGDAIVHGELVNNCSWLYVEDTITFSETGSYTGDGWMYHHSDNPQDQLSDWLIGLDTSELEVQETRYEGDTWVYWNIRNLSHLPRMGTPKDLMWNKEYTWVQSGSGWKQKLVDRMGAVTWTPVKPLPDRYKISYYRDGEFWAAFDTWFGAETGVPYVSDTMFVGSDPESGTYYFTVQALGDGQNYRGSEVATSGEWEYTKPGKSLRSCTDLYWDGLVMEWTTPDGDYLPCEMEIYYAATAEEEPFLTSGAWGMSTADNMELWEDIIQWHGEGYYYFRVRALSDDITKVCNGPWSEMSPAFHLDFTVDDVKAQLGDISTKADDQVIRDSVQSIGMEDLLTSMENEDVLTQLQKLEKAVGGAAAVEVTDAVSQLDAGKISILGASLNTPVDASQPISLVLDAPKLNKDLIDVYDEDVAVRFSMTLENVADADDLDVPVKVTLPVPGNIHLEQLVIIQFKENGWVNEYKLEDLELSQKDGTTFVSLLLTGFSDFVITNFADTAVASGMTGDVNWEVTQWGKLVLSGEGNTGNYNEETQTPWATYADQITSIVVEEGIIVLSDYVFADLYNVTNVTLPDSLTGIGAAAFSGCSSLESITIPGKVDTIFYWAFAYCDSLKEFRVDEENPWYYTVDGVLYYAWDMGKMLVAYPGGKTDTSYTITEPVIQIGPGAFQGNQKLTEVILPQGIKVILLNTFEDSALKTITIPESVTYIDLEAFANCSDLQTLYFLGDAVQIEHNTFTGTTATCYYLADNDTWTEDKFQNYGGNLTWIKSDYIEITGESAVEGGKSVKLSAQIMPEHDKNAKIAWELAEGDEEYATLKASGNTATITAVDVSEPHVITVTASSVQGIAPCEFELTIQPQVKELKLYQIWWDENDEEQWQDLAAYEWWYWALDEYMTDGFEMYLVAEFWPEGSNTQVTWSSSNTKVATVDEYGVAHFTGKTGTTVITATAENGVKASFTQKVIDPVDNVEPVGDTVIELMGGQSTTLKVINTDTDKAITGKNIEWSLWMPDGGDASAYAAISSSGKLTTKKVVEEVSFYVYADVLTDEVYTSYVEYEVILYPAATHVELCDEEGRNLAGETILLNVDEAYGPTFTATVLPDDSMPVPVKWEIGKAKWVEDEETGMLQIADKYATYTLDPETNELAVSDPTGKAGTVTIKATAQDGSKKSATVKIKFGIMAEDVEITNEETELVSGKSLSLKAKTVPAKVTTSGVIWSLADPADAAYVKLSGSKITAQNIYEERDVTLIAASKDGNAAAEYTITIKPKDPGALCIYDAYTGQNVTKSTIYSDLSEKDRYITLVARNLEDGSEADVQWSWKKNDSKYDIYESEDGLEIFMGTASSVTITAKEGKRTATVTIKAANLGWSVDISTKDGKNIVYDEEGVKTIQVASGKSVNLQASVMDRNGRAASNTKVTWSILEGSGATISSSGKLTADKNVTSTQVVWVRATAADGSGAYGDIPVQVKPLATGIEIFSELEESGEVLFSLYNNGRKFVWSNTTLVWDMTDIREDGSFDTTFDIDANVYPFYEDDEARSAIQAVTWKSSSTKVASIDANGMVTCYQAGTTTITATAADGSGQKISFKLTVQKGMNSLSLQETADVAGGKSITLKPIIEPLDTTNKKLTWGIYGDTAFASINQSGKLTTRKVTSVKTVYVYVWSQDNNELYAECEVKIYPKAVTKVSLFSEGVDVTGKTIELSVGESIILTSDNSPYNASQMVTWKSSAEANATVEDGVVTAIKAGKTVTITCTAADGSNKKATVKIKVVN